MVRSLCLAVCCAVVAILVMPSDAYPSPNYYGRNELQYEPEEIVDMLSELNNILEMERKMETLKEEKLSSDKRALDLGLSRGYSGALQAKHLMALAAAADAGGPGRRRRNSP